MKEYKQAINLFFLFTFLQNIAANLAHPVTPTLMLNLGLGDYMFGLAFAAMAFTNFLFSPFWGKLVNVFSEKRIMMIGCLGYSFAQYLFMISTTELDIIIARSLAGLFMSGTMVCGLTYILMISKEEDKGKNLTIYTTILTVAGTVGYLIGGILGDFGVQFSFLLQVFLLVIVGISYGTLLKPRNNLQSYTVSNLVKEANPLKSMMNIKNHWSSLLILLFIVSFISSLATTTYDQSFNYYIKDIFNFPPSYNGIIKATVGIVSLITNLTLCIAIINKKKIEFSLIYIFLFCSICLLGITIVNEISFFLIINVLFFAGNSIYLPLLQNLCSKFGDENNRNTILGFYNSAKSFGMILGGLIAGFVYTLNVEFPFIIAAFCFLISSIIMINYYKAKLNTK